MAKCFVFLHAYYLQEIIASTLQHPHQPRVSLSPSVCPHRQAADSYLHPPLKHFFFSKLLNTTASPQSV